MLKNRVSFYFLLSTTLLILSGCSIKEPENNLAKDECVVDKVKAPAWVCPNYRDDFRYYEVTSASKSNFNSDLTKNKFIGEAKEKLTKQIQSDVKNRVDQYVKSEGKKNQEMVDSVSTLVWNQHSKEIFSNTGEISYWENKSNNKIYVLLTAEKTKILTRFDNDIKVMVDDTFEIKNSEEALNRLINY